MEKIIKFFLSICLFVAISTEVLSFFDCLNKTGIFCIWSIILAFFIIYLYYKTHFHFSLKTKIVGLLKVRQQLPKKEQFIFFALLIYIILLGISALIQAPFNFDSMTYHLARCAYWIQNESVASYPVMNDRQLVFTPFSEYFMTHLMILTNSDYLVNLVQFLAYILSGFLVYLICCFFQLSKKLSMIGSGLFYLIPMAMLQSVTTQNDLVCTFFVLASVYFGLKITRKYVFGDLFAFSIAVACGMLTKGTFYFFAVPFLLWFGVLYLKTYHRGIFSIVLVPLFTVIIVNTPFWTRNIVLYGHPVSAGKTFLAEYPDFVVNKNIQKNPSWRHMISTLSKNLYLHAQMPQKLSIFDPLPLVKEVHNLIGVKADDPALNPFGAQFYPFMINEDVSGNVTTFYLLFVSLILFIWVRPKKTILLYLVCLWGGYFLYTFLTTYQPWATRLDLPFFALSIPFIIYVWQHCRFIKGRWAIGLLFVFLILAFPYEYSIVTKSFPRQEREVSYFLRAPDLYSIYKQVPEEMKRLNVKHLGLALHEDAWEYPLFVLTKQIPDREIKAIQIKPYYHKQALSQPFVYEAILTNNPFFLKETAPLLIDFIDLSGGFYFLILKEPQDKYYEE